MIRECFREYEVSLILIGGAACDDWFTRQSLEFRLTMDLGIVPVPPLPSPPRRRGGGIGVLCAMGHSDSSNNSHLVEAINNQGVFERRIHASSRTTWNRTPRKMNFASLEGSAQDRVRDGFDTRANGSRQHTPHGSTSAMRQYSLLRLQLILFPDS
jgi:hypothetical protein